MAEDYMAGLDESTARFVAEIKSRPAVARKASAVRDIQALDEHYRPVDWHKQGDVFEVIYDCPASDAWMAAGPDGKMVALWVGADIRFEESNS